MTHCMVLFCGTCAGLSDIKKLHSHLNVLGNKHVLFRKGNTGSFRTLHKKVKEIYKMNCNLLCVALRKQKEKAAKVRNY